MKFEKITSKTHWRSHGFFNQYIRTELFQFYFIQYNAKGHGLIKNLNSKTTKRKELNQR